MNFCCTTLLFLLLSVASVQCQNSIPPYGNNPEAGKYAEVNGIKIYYEIYGEGEPLLLIHGNGGSIKSSTPKIEYYKRKYQVIVMDSRAHGKTQDIGDSLTYEQMTADINAVLDRLSIDSCYIWGQSDGGIIGLKLAIDYPDKVKKLAVFGANLRPEPGVVYDEIEDWLNQSIANATDEYKLRLLLLMKYQPQIPISDLSKIKAPVLVMTGDRDVIRLEHSIEVFSNIKKSNLFVMPGATHFGSYEKPELFFQVLDDFFTKPVSTISTYDIIKDLKY
ncbi:MAG: alpha/beta hydrolase [Reichenbachiella sp.]|uniref:alpha/beta fold hydrolase n=1 Tax=Reichenbachiella sp. TaxID=2184521 RepID=UPI0029662F63|nr:alpha/beta hydrolase [Reichenbachiella sp.]MDW3211243.1 alpha/beta hydrolase [Reichenbachiella sp.]